MFDTLKDFASVAWDFDDTLIGHPKSPHFWRFIRLNPYAQHHHIITMRSHGLEYFMFDELEKHKSGLDRMHFDKIINVPNALYEQFHRAKVLKTPLHQNHDYFMFKGEQCKAIGAQVLIDDMEAVGLSQRGCDLHGILHIHPDAL